MAFKPGDYLRHKADTENTGELYLLTEDGFVEWAEGRIRYVGYADWPVQVYFPEAHFVKVHLHEAMF